MADAKSTIVIHDEIKAPNPSVTGSTICFQKVTYHYADDATQRSFVSRQDGFRFVWKKPDGSIRPTRGYARIPSLSHLEGFLKEARRRGWDGAGDGTVF